MFLKYIFRRGSRKKKGKGSKTEEGEKRGKKIGKEFFPDFTQINEYYDPGAQNSGNFLTILSKHQMSQTAGSLAVWRSDTGA